jgi:hypothetical protein
MSETKPENRGYPYANSEKAPGRINGSGMIHIDETRLLETIPLYYYSKKSKWFGPRAGNSFTPLKDNYAANMVAEYGITKILKDDRGLSPANRAMMWIIQNRSVDFAGSVSGYRTGVHTANGMRFLVTDEPELILPAPGDWEPIRILIDTMLADQKHPQPDVFYTWMAQSYRAFMERMTTNGGQFRFCPALGIFGPKNCGKSMLIEKVIAPMLGNRTGDPLVFLNGKEFNEDLMGAALLVLDDKGASANLTERRQRGESMKDMIWKPRQRLEGKGESALMVTPFWRLVIAGNNDDNGYNVSPALSPSLEDKYILILARMAEGLPTNDAENDAWCAKVRAALPAFADWLMKYKPPETIALDSRTRVINFQHPNLVAALREMQPEMKLIELIDSLGLVTAAEPAPFWTGTASEFESLLRSLDKHGVVERLLTGSTTAGRMLSEVSRVLPDRIKRVDFNGQSRYRIFSPKKPQASA